MEEPPSDVPPDNSTSCAKTASKKTHPCHYQECQQLGRAFSCDHNLQQHIRERHTHERPHHCDECRTKGKEAAFARPWGLTRHLLKVHGLDRTTRDSPSAVSQAANLPTEAAFTDMKPVIGPSLNDAGPCSSRGPAPRPTLPHPLTPACTTDQVILQPLVYSPPYARSTVFANVSTPANLASDPTECFDCGVLFPNLEECLEHHHVAHSQRYTVFCSCADCKTFRALGAFDSVAPLSSVG